MITKCSCRISCGRSILFGGLHALSSFSQIYYSSQLLSFFRLHSVTFISLFSNCRQSLCPLKEKMFFKAALKIFLIFFKKYFIHTILQILKCRSPHKMGHYASISCLVYASLGLSNISRVSPISTTRPSFMTIILSHNWYTTSISCDIKI